MGVLDVFLVTCIIRIFNASPGGEIGRRRGLKIPRRKVCRFESDPGHHIQKIR